jgi:hypothetical protein
MPRRCEGGKRRKFASACGYARNAFARSGGMRGAATFARGAAFFFTGGTSYSRT